MKNLDNWLIQQFEEYLGGNASYPVLMSCSQEQ